LILDLRTRGGNNFRGPNVSLETPQVPASAFALRPRGKTTPKTLGEAVFVFQEGKYLLFPVVFSPLLSSISFSFVSSSLRLLPLSISLFLPY